MVVAVLAVAFLLPSLPPHSLGEHCARLSATEVPHHPAGHDGRTNNTRDHDADPCPHCPPAECPSAVSCSSVIVATVDPAVAAPTTAALARPDQPEPRIRRTRNEPPTPPPQDPFRIA